LKTKTIIFFAAAVLWGGCVTTDNRYPIPEPDVFWEIHHESRDNCLSKSRRYALILKERGYNTTLVVVDLGNDRLHAVVLVEGWGWFDPALARSGREIGGAGRFLMEMR